MRLHTDNLSYGDILRALANAQDEDQIDRGLYFDEIKLKGSRKRGEAYELHLGIDYHTPGRRRPNPGTNPWHLAKEDRAEWAATYDEWGYVIAQLFALDPDAIVGPYAGEQSFHSITKGKYA